jgi:hypothetical protein
VEYGRLVHGCELRVAREKAAREKEEKMKRKKDKKQI